MSCRIQVHVSVTATKGPFTPSDSVTITVALTGGTFDLYDGNCDGQNGLHTHFSHQRYGHGDGVAWREQALMDKAWYIYLFPLWGWTRHLQRWAWREVHPSWGFPTAWARHPRARSSSRIQTSSPSSSGSWSQARLLGVGPRGFVLYPGFTFTRALEGVNRLLLGNARGRRRC